MIGLVRKKKAWRRHGGKELEYFRSGLSRAMLKVGSDIANSGQERWIDGVKFSFAGSHEIVDGL